jgi:hypothetical protein
MKLPYYAKGSVKTEETDEEVAPSPEARLRNRGMDAPYSVHGTES